MNQRSYLVLYLSVFNVLNALIARDALSATNNPTTASHSEECNASVLDRSNSVDYVITGFGETETEARSRAVQVLHEKLSLLAAKICMEETPSPRWQYSDGDLHRLSILWDPDLFFSGISTETRTLACQKIAVTISSPKRALNDRYVVAVTEQQRVVASELELADRRIKTIQSVLKLGISTFNRSKLEKSSSKLAIAAFRWIWLDDEARRLNGLILSQHRVGSRLPADLIRFSKSIENDALSSAHFFESLL